jgi:hypothetical protein
MSRPITAGIGLFLVSFLASTGALAQEDRFEIAGHGGYLFGGSVDAEAAGGLKSTASLESAPAYGGIIDVALRRGQWAELTYTRGPTTLTLRQSDGQRFQYDVLLQYFQIGGLLEFRTPTLDWLRPVFGGTIGATVFTANDEFASYEEWRLSLIFDGGAKIRLTNFLGVRLQARGFITFLTDESAMFCASGAGCAFAATGTALLQGELGGAVYLAF